MELKELVELLNFSNYTWQILAPVIFSVADVITGFIQAVINKDVDSTKMRNGLLHKVILMVIVVLSFVADATFSINFVAKVVCIYVIFMETLSISENITKAGINLGKLTEILKIGKGDK